MGIITEAIVKCSTSTKVMLENYNELLKSDYIVNWSRF